MSFVFYDTETTGIDPFFDQILQFAAIKTDIDFQVEDRFEIRCRLRPHIIPAAGALRVTGVSIEQCTDPSLPSHLEMALEISEKIDDWSGSVFLGWNTIPFDEEFLRQAFYQSLLPPYQTNMNGNMRTDLLPLAQAAYFDSPDVLVVPQNARGRPSFKLDQLAPANGFPHLDAHDAMADVEATIHIARILRETAREHWSNLMRFANKNAANDFVASERVVVLTEAHFGRAGRYALAPLGTHPEITSEHYCFDLGHDPSTFAHLNADQLAAAIQRSPKPIRRIRTNRSPVLMSGDDVETVNGVDIETLEQRADILDQINGLKPALLEAAIAHHNREYDNQEAEQQIYAGFSQNPDQQRMEAFHAAPWNERLTICRSFDDQRLKRLGLRLICEHAIEYAPANLSAKYNRFVQRRLQGRNGGEEAPWRTLAKAQEELAEARRDFDDPKGILDGLESYLVELEQRYGRA